VQGRLLPVRAPVASVRPVAAAEAAALTKAPVGWLWFYQPPLAAWGGIPSRFVSCQALRGVNSAWCFIGPSTTALAGVVPSLEVLV
jgi:hypothetical protein